MKYYTKSDDEKFWQEVDAILLENEKRMRQVRARREFARNK